MILDYFACDRSKKLESLSQPIKTNTKTNPKFPRPSNRLAVFTLNTYQLMMMMLTSLLIGSCDHLGLSTVNWKLLYTFYHYKHKGKHSSSDTYYLLILLKRKITKFCVLEKKKKLSLKNNM